METKFNTAWAQFLRISPILMFVFLLLWLRSCQENVRQSDRYSENLQAKEKAIRSHQLANGQLAYEKDLLSVTHEELKDRVLGKDDSLRLLKKKIKDPAVVVKWNTRYVYDTVHIPFDSLVDHEFQSSFSKTEEWFSLSGIVNREGISISRLSLPNTQRLVVGYKQGKPVVSVTNSNPHLLTEAIEGQLIRVPERHWVLGVGGTWNIYDPPSVGLFLGYKFFEF